MEAGAQCPGFCFSEDLFVFILKKLHEGQSMQLQPGLYQHYKGPQYRVFSVARHSETEEEVVFYQALYGDYGFWVRPLSMFLESVEVDGEQVPRFALVQAEPSLFSPA
ncbi:hypothetical protein ABH911_004016 [Pseudomonas protegens]|jgi:hypothetical protein|uniref:DUF1653 domain-containing protein n=6 Tax=Pseudomonas TaxID=286 RepID=A0A2C9EJE2_PSEPH|nr:hypothetical protein PFLCHA0_c19960 [Pseudomonas protegens CHA0]MCS4260284.1 hypothetical protein [Pseudomonas sp. BIGb0176]MDT3419556.1 hypothetical protein [Pseudomonas protegens]BAO61360.1 TonB box-like [Pseudomonas protegens Cab57]GED78506.1 hypothetical protein PFL02_53560 [Pseudomonas fluorescens]